ncbi:uncharacterized protein M437DRAFT_56779 [Aureobasidium melanogenum CBS 110374]|uniref:Zn(2)-C6 fungal-type domain-containing protein n=1 Tax=Aureobasidium melanogenum (strain CBS 110374) TaxID=1043003 RepID=A0A074VF72_AURM1|nr:uncharacterized protein M437DRAFT_56779 [Aureobasidium melanogenum CBS 110374]KEQ59410.1 hypothetical protein M437DRAFT_56779 [Aureobasidium melanogenum CBS 110374]
MSIPQPHDLGIVPKNKKRRNPDGARRVVCEPCHASKLKCDRGRPCSRCTRRQVECIYAPPPARKKHPTGPDWRAILNIVEPPVTKTWSEYQSSFSAVDLICPIDVERVKTRWLEGFASALDRQPKVLGPGVTFFTLTTLRSWPRMLTQTGTGSPPFIHPSQLQNSEYPPPLARCVTIAHMWANQTSDGGDIVRETILREAQALFESDRLGSSNDMERLVTMQAYLLLCLMLLPSCTTEPMTIPQEMKINLQELTAKSAREGLICPAEQTGSRPDYSSWILAEAKRRTIYAIYMLDDVINTLGNMPCVLGDELGILPMTCSKMLWLACSSQESWEQEYNTTLASGKYLRLEELWIHPADEQTRRRRERWLAAVDEFGLMIYAVATISQLH